MSIGLIGHKKLGRRVTCVGVTILWSDTHMTLIGARQSEAELYHLFITDWPARQAGVGAGGDNNKQSS